MYTHIEQIEVSTVSGQDIFDGKFKYKPGVAMHSIANLTLKVSADVELLINESEKPVLIKKDLGFSITNTCIKTIKPLKSGVEIYAIFSY